MSFPTYGRMKDSGVEWLGDVPEGWDCKTIKQIASCNDDVLEEDTDPDYEIEYLEISGVEFGRGSLSTSQVPFKSAASRARRRVMDGDIIVSTVRTYLRAIATVITPPENLVVSTGFAVIRPRYVHSAYLGYAFQSEPIIAHVIAQSVGVSYPAINASDLMRIVAPVPPLPEQTAIAAFLDRETGKIDALVEEQKRLIELLQEKRQAVISQAVTKGLDPKVRMKPSGVEWLGDVPEHWEVKPLKHAGYFKAGSGFPDDEQGVEGEKISFHKVNAIGRADPEGYLLPSDNTISDETAEKLRAFVFPRGSIVFAKIGAALLLGRIRLIREPACIDNNMMGFVTNENNDDSYCRHLMSLIQFDLIANPGTVPSLNEGQISNQKFGFPPLPEQTAISSFLDRACDTFSALTGQAQSAITLLQERRSALISAAVTGKIDVRGLVADEAQSEAA